MQLVEKIRTWSLGVAAASMIFAGAAVAQASDSSQAQNGELTGANARLVHSLDAASARQGQSIEAKLLGSVKTDTGLKLDKGTLLKGTVTDIQKADNGGQSSVTLNFNQAQLRSGKDIPVKVTLLAAFPPSSADQATYGMGDMGTAPQHVNPKLKVDQEAGQLSHISLHSSVQSDNSGTFQDNTGNLKLHAGTYLQVGIAPAGANNASGE